MKIAKERIIFDNYKSNFTDEDLTETARLNEWIGEDETPTDEQLWSWRAIAEEDYWADESVNLTNFFKGKTVIMFGSVGRWDGIRSGWDVGEFGKLFYDFTRDCDYWKIYDINGHMYITCSHHDGTNHFEIREVNGKGEYYLENCERNYRSPSLKQMMHKYTRLPRFSEKVFGCKAREYEETTKEKLINMVNNMARSNYA